MEVARVAESRTPAFSEGDVLACAYGHATMHVADPLNEHLVLLGKDLDPLLGVFVAHLGPICANGLLHAAAEATGGMVRRLADGVDGRQVLVTGAGPIGLLTALFARSLGAREVAVADSDPRRRQVAADLGFPALDLDDDPGKLLKERWRHGPADRGADVVFQCRGRPEALHAALRAARPQGSIIDLAFYTSGAEAVRLGEEFHHNGLVLRCAQIGRVPRGLTGQWDRARLSAETIRLLRSHGDVIRKHLISDVVPYDNAPRLMHEVSQHQRQVLTAVFAVAPHTCKHVLTSLLPGRTGTTCRVAAENNVIARDGAVLEPADALAEDLHDDGGVRVVFGIQECLLVAGHVVGHGGADGSTPSQESPILADCGLRREAQWPDALSG